MAIPILNLDDAQIPERRIAFLQQLRNAMFNIGFLYIKNHGVSDTIIDGLVKKAPALFDLPRETKLALSKVNSPHFLGYSGYAEEKTMGVVDLREQFDFATELPIIYDEEASPKQEDERDYSRMYWRLRGPNMWPEEDQMPGFKHAVLDYHDALTSLSYRFVHLIEEAFGIPVGACDAFFGASNASPAVNDRKFLPPQNRVKLAKYHVPHFDHKGQAQGVGAHKDSSGWLTFLLQIGNEKGLEVLDQTGEWIAADPIPGTLVVNFGNAFEAATEGAVRATVHRVRAPIQRDRYSIPFFMGLPVDLKLSEIRACLPEHVRQMRANEDTHANAKETVEKALPAFVDARWDSIGESVLRKWIRAYPHVGLKWYGPEAVTYYTQA